MGLAYLIFKKTVLESAMALTSNQDQEHSRGHGWNTLHPITYCLLFESTQDQGSLTFWHQGPASWKTIFRRRVGWFRDDSSALHLLCTFSLLLLPQLHLRSSDPEAEDPCSKRTLDPCPPPTTLPESVTLSIQSVRGFGFN